MTVCILFLFVTFASLFYIVEEANHHCTGEACPVCANIHQAEQTLRNLSTGTIVHAAVNPILIMCVLVVVTTIFPEYDWVKEIAGDKASNMDPTMLLDNGVDLHSYQPTSDDILKISDCDLFVYVGGESDGWVDDALKSGIWRQKTRMQYLRA